MRSIAIVIALAALLPATSVAQDAAPEGQAEAEDARARELFAQAADAYGREMFTVAEDGFRAAYDAMSPDNPRRALILLNLAQAIERQGGRDEDALAAWQHFRAEAAEVAEEVHLQRADARIRELTARAERRRAAGAEDVAAPAAEPSGFDPHWSGVVLTAVGGAALLAGAVVGILGLAERGDIVGACNGTSCPADLRDRAAGLETYGVAADALMWPGLGLAAVGVVLMFLVPNAPAEDASVAASCGPGGCTLGWRW